jgi:hypothetical protein
MFLAWRDTPRRHGSADAGLNGKRASRFLPFRGGIQHARVQSLTVGATGNRRSLLHAG